MLTHEDIIKGFWAHIKPNKKLMRQKNKIDYLGQHTSDIRNAMVEYVEELRSKGEISDEIANSISLYKNDAIRFAEWVTSQRLVKYNEGWCEMGGSNGMHLTDSQLYSQYIKTTQK
jgi:hypothetical protein